MKFENLTDSLILIAHSRQRFALSVTTGVFVTASARADGTAVISISSRVSLDMNALFATSSSKLRKSALKYLNFRNLLKLGKGYRHFNTF